MGFLAGSNARRKPKSLVNGLCLAPLVPKLQLVLPLVARPQAPAWERGSGRRGTTVGDREREGKLELAIIRPTVRRRLSRQRTGL